MLIAIEEKKSIKEIIQKHKEWLATIFESTTWDNQIVMGNRGIWVKCWGVPISL